METRRAFAIVLVPPGPQRREANRVAASVFAATGDPSSLALPDIVVLATGSRRPDAAMDLRALWTGIEGSFEAAGVEAWNGFLYLRVGGPLREIAANATALLDGDCALRIETGRGFFLGRGGLAPEGLAQERFSFRSARLALLDLEGELSGLAWFSWKEIASAWRPKKAVGGVNRPMAGKIE